MSGWVVRNGDWFLSEGPSWAISTWSTNPHDATTYPTRLAARKIASVCRRSKLLRPFGERPETARADRKPETP